MLDSFQALYDIVKKLRDPGGCPWDREQDPQSIRGNLLEETLECIDAIEENDFDHIREELGDLYLLVTMLTYMYEEKETFTLRDVLQEINEKLIRRHPHVFGDIEVADSKEVLKNWEHIKRHVENPEVRSIMGSIPKGLHPMERSYKIQKKAAKYGFDWDTLHGVLKKIQSEVLECEEAAKLSKDDLEDELGDLLFSVINACRFNDIDPSLALNRTNKKFLQRFVYIEKKMEAQGKEPGKAHTALMNTLWEEAKQLKTSDTASDTQ
ncbi:MAG: nucleoside triphosphate pyrophosphohydrolase [Spirochaetales bacterium]|nr:nucleoside triphosphate pyrophosphohydrolase [Spirochaetales bacterium]